MNMSMVDRDVLYNLYIVEKMPMHSIARELNMSVGKVFNNIKKYGIESRPKQGFLGRKHSSEALKKISAANKGKKRTIETRKRISESRKLKSAGHKKLRDDGYIGVYFPKHPSASKDGYVLEHRLIMENHIGRSLKNDEVVHHKNHIRTDNRLENLQLMTFKEHARLHMIERWQKKRGEMTYQ